MSPGAVMTAKSGALLVCASSECAPVAALFVIIDRWIASNRKAASALKSLKDGTSIKELSEKNPLQALIRHLNKAQRPRKVTKEEATIVSMLAIEQYIRGRATRGNSSCKQTVHLNTCRNDQGLSSDAEYSEQSFFQLTKDQLEDRLPLLLRRLGFSETEVRSINTLVELATKIHDKQKPRKSGEPYIQHPLSVAVQLVEKATFVVAFNEGLAKQAEKFKPLLLKIMADALLHDAVEDQTPEVIALITGKQPIRSIFFRGALTAWFWADQIGSPRQGSFTQQVLDSVGRSLFGCTRTFNLYNTLRDKINALNNDRNKNLKWLNQSIIAGKLLDNFVKSLPPEGTLAYYDGSHLLEILALSKSLIKDTQFYYSEQFACALLGGMIKLSDREHNLSDSPNLKKLISNIYTTLKYIISGAQQPDQNSLGDNQEFFLVKQFYLAILSLSKCSFERLFITNLRKFHAEVDQNTFRQSQSNAGQADPNFSSLIEAFKQDQSGPYKLLAYLRVAAEADKPPVKEDNNPHLNRDLFLAFLESTYGTPTQQAA